MLVMRCGRDRRAIGVPIRRRATLRIGLLQPARKGRGHGRRGDQQLQGEGDDGDPRQKRVASPRQNADPARQTAAPMSGRRKLSARTMRVKQIATANCVECVQDDFARVDFEPSDREPRGEARRSLLERAEAPGGYFGRRRRRHDCDGFATMRNYLPVSPAPDCSSAGNVYFSDRREPGHGSRER